MSAHSLPVAADVYPQMSLPYAPLQHVLRGTWCWSATLSESKLAAGSAGPDFGCVVGRMWYVSPVGDVDVMLAIRAMF